MQEVVERSLEHIFLFVLPEVVADTAAARLYLHQELEECRSTDLQQMPEEEPTGFRHRFTRMNLSSVLEGELTEDRLLAMFVEASGNDNAFGDDWVGEWDKIANIALQVNPNWRDSELLQALHDAAKANRPVRHSEAFREAYNPHYRIVKGNSNLKN